MKTLLLFAIMAFGFAVPQATQASELITPTPQCATIKNESPFTMNGSIRTEYGKARDGTKKRHESNFRLAKGESKEACSTGPFYPGYQVELTLKTLIPVFSCKTRLTGTISLRADTDRETGKNKIYALCIGPDPMGFLGR